MANDPEIPATHRLSPRRRLPFSVRWPGARTADDHALLDLCAHVLSATIAAGAQTDPVLSATQIRVLSLISAAPPDGLSLTSVATGLASSASSASRLCQRLVRDGLLDRAAGPGNELRLSLSSRGSTVLADTNRLRLAALRERLLALVPADARTMIDALSAAIPQSKDAP